MRRVERWRPSNMCPLLPALGYVAGGSNMMTVCYVLQITNRIAWPIDPCYLYTTRKLLAFISYQWNSQYLHSIMRNCTRFWRDFVVRIWATVCAVLSTLYVGNVWTSARTELYDKMTDITLATSVRRVFNTRKLVNVCWANYRD